MRSITAVDSMPEATGDTEKDLKNLRDYVYQLSEQLRYVLNNLDAENFNTAELPELFKGTGINIGDGNFRVDENGNVTVAGTMQWTSSSTPLHVMYTTDLVNFTGEWDPAWSASTETEVWAMYSYDGGNTWTDLVMIQGKSGEDGEDGRDGSDADVTFAKVNAVLGYLYKTKAGGTPTTVTGSYIYSPEVLGGNIYGTNIYAGVGSSAVAQMAGEGLSLYDDTGGLKAFLGRDAGYTEAAYVGNYAPMLELGKSVPGRVEKFYSGGHKLWIGDAGMQNGIKIDLDGRGMSFWTAGVDVSLQSLIGT